MKPHCFAALGPARGNLTHRNIQSARVPSPKGTFTSYPSSIFLSVIEICGSNLSKFQNHPLVASKEIWQFFRKKCCLSAGAAAVGAVHRGLNFRQVQLLRQQGRGLLRYWILQVSPHCPWINGFLELSKSNFLNFDRISRKKHIKIYNIKLVSLDIPQNIFL
jgi:hypothetical protein